MKFLTKILFVSVLAFLITGCEDDDNKFTGSPIGNLSIVTLKGDISTSAQSALSDQKIDFTVTLPRTFADTVTVEATAISNGGRRLRGYVDVLPGDLTATGDIFAPGGSIFDTTFDLYLSGIALNTTEPGVHYLLESDVLQIPTGNSSIPSQDANALIVRLVWLNPSSSVNTLQMTVQRPTLPAITLNYSNGIRQHKINTAQTGNNTSGISTVPGDYVFSIYGSGFTGAMDVPYRLIIVYPNGDAEVYSGTYSGSPTDSPVRPLVQINKSFNELNQVQYSITNLFP